MTGPTLREPSPSRRRVEGIVDGLIQLGPGPPGLAGGFEATTRMPVGVVQGAEPSSSGDGR